MKDIFLRQIRPRKTPEMGHFYFMRVDLLYSALMTRNFAGSDNNVERICSSRYLFVYGHLL